ncbi:MAG: phosphopantothenoylcysteine decarboxylase [Candidatus Gygaella obscura]|nr:phosphopantothenoylcysteine decarboxylase [Candidatus Gygaella obscura]
MKKQLNNKKVLVTAGPTWIAIDKVRVITSIFSGKTGCKIAQDAKKLGAKVKLLLGSGVLDLKNNKLKGISVIRFKYYDELFKLMKQEISTRNYDMIIHSAAVSDYKPNTVTKQKIASGKKTLSLKLKPTKKIVKLIKKWDPQTFLVQFKLETNKSKNSLIKKAYESLKENNADLVIANDLRNLDKVNIIAKDKKQTSVKRNDITKQISKLINN